jgi:hypothetical protein
MKTYEIRIIRKGAGAFIYATSHASDYAAIRRAKSLAEEGDIVEVWNGLNCVFTEAPAHLGLGRRAS